MPPTRAAKAYTQTLTDAPTDAPPPQETHGTTPQAYGSSSYPTPPAQPPHQDTPRPLTTSSATQSPQPSDALSHAPNADAATAQKPFTHPTPFVGIVLPTRPPRCHRQRRVNIRHHRIWTLVKTDHRTLRVIRLGIHLQHRLHSPDKVRRHLRQTPLLLLPRLERVFLACDAPFRRRWSPQRPTQSACLPLYQSPIQSS